MNKLTFVLSNDLELTWSENDRMRYHEFFHVLTVHLKKENLTVKSVIKETESGSTTTFNLAFDN